MKLKLWAILLITFTVLTSLSAEIKRYEIKSGIIEYTITQSGNMMGMSINGKGTAKTAFKEWGNIELHSEESVTTTMGQKEHDKIMTKVDNGKVFVVDFNQKVIYEYTPDLLANSEHKDLIKTGKEVLTSMGAKKIGEEKFMGYACEVWQMMHVKLWLYKGIMLKSEADMMGIKHTTVATKIDLDASVSENDLALPNFPIKSGAQDMMPGGMENEGEIPQLTPEQLQQMQEMMKSFSQK